jgi:hypothetical protein
MTAQTFKLGTEFPREGFVQRCLERHFGENGYKRTSAGHTDFACIHPSSGERWVVEAKGETADVGLDFCTGLGQLLQAMGDPSARYGLAIPGTPKFFTQIRNNIRMRRGCEA